MPEDNTHDAKYGFFGKENMKKSTAPVSYVGHGLWRCSDGCLRDDHYGLHDVGPFDYYLRVPIPAGKTGRIRLNLGEGSDMFPSHGKGEPLPETDRAGTLADTNLPPRGRIFDESLDLLEVSWCMLIRPEQVLAVQQLLDGTVLEFYVGGEKPFYQCNMAVMARWEKHAVRGSFVLSEPMNLRRFEKRWLDLYITREDASVPLELFVCMHCRRYRGVC